MSAMAILNSEWAFAICLGILSVMEMINSEKGLIKGKKISTPITLNSVCAATTHFASILEPMLEIMAVAQVPIFAPKD